LELRLEEATTRIFNYLEGADDSSGIAAGGGGGGYLASRTDVRFRCIVVDKSKAGHEKSFQNDRQFGFWVFYLHCLKQWMGNQNTYYISIDFKPESLHSGPRRLGQALQKECIGRCWLKSLACVDSKENLFCQLATSSLARSATNRTTWRAARPNALSLRTSLAPLSTSGRGKANSYHITKISQC
jgi:hypothetical protein